MLAGTGSPPVGGTFRGGATALGFTQVRRRDRTLRNNRRRRRHRLGRRRIERRRMDIPSARARPLLVPVVAVRAVVDGRRHRNVVARWGARDASGRRRRTISGLFLAGPIREEWHYPNQFWGHLRYQFDYDPAHNPYVRRCRPIRTRVLCRTRQTPAGKRHADRGAVAARITLQRAVAVPGYASSAEDRTGDAAVRNLRLRRISGERGRNADALDRASRVAAARAKHLARTTWSST